MVKLILLVHSELVEEYWENFGHGQPTDLSEWYPNENFFVREFATTAEADAYVKGVDDIADGVLSYAFAAPEDVTGIDL